MVLKKIDGGLNNPSEGLKSNGSISTRQIKAVWALANRLGITEEDLHSRIESMTGKRSIRLLSRQEAQKIIHELFLMTKTEKSGPETFMEEEGGITRAQATLIHQLGLQLGWNPQQVLGLARKMYKTQELNDLTVKQASGLIEALKAMKKRHVA